MVGNEGVMLDCHANVVQHILVLQRNMACYASHRGLRGHRGLELPGLLLHYAVASVLCVAVVVLAWFAGVLRIYPP
jgi:hypothetical protein